MSSPSIRPIDRTFQVLSLRARVDLGAMVMKGTSPSSKLMYYWNLAIRLFNVVSRKLVVGGLTPLQRCSRRILLTITLPKRLGYGDLRWIRLQWNTITQCWCEKLAIIIIINQQLYMADIKLFEKHFLNIGDSITHNQNIASGYRNGNMP